MGATFKACRTVTPLWVSGRPRTSIQLTVSLIESRSSLNPGPVGFFPLTSTANLPALITHPEPRAFPGRSMWRFRPRNFPATLMSWPSAVPGWVARSSRVMSGLGSRGPVGVARVRSYSQNATSYSGGSGLSPWGDRKTPVISTSSSSLGASAPTTAASSARGVIGIASSPSISR